jgi:putative ABC transport system permease protein
MAFFARVASLIRNLTRRNRIERELDEELRATAEMLAAEKMRAGHSPDAARRAALVELGGIEPIKERVRDVRAGAMLDTLGQDIRYAVRLLRRYPLFALTAALSLAVGIGANTAVFTIGSSLLRFSPAAIAEPNRIVDIGRSLDGLSIGFNPGSYPDYLDIRRGARTLEHVYARTLFPRSMTLADSAGVEKVVAEVVTTNYFAALGTRPAVGRLFNADESDRPGESPIVVLSHRFWTRRFNADPAIVGHVVRLNQFPMTVVGVAPEAFQGTTIAAPDLWVPLGMTATADQLEARRSGWVVMGARLAPGATMAQATAELDTIDRGLREQYPGQQAARSYRLLPASPMAGNLPVAVAAVLLLGAIATTILVIACANVAGLLLARASARRREMALRVAIGAGRWRLVRLLLTETVMLFALGSAAGIALARVMTVAVVGLLPALPIPVQMSLAIDWRVVAFACGLSLAASLLSGLAPAIHASRADVSTILKAESPGASARNRLRHAFVIAQIACSLLLIVIGSLFIRALQQTASAAAGFDSRGVEVASIDSSISRQVLERVRQLPGVQSASMAYYLPLSSEAFGFGLSLPGAETTGDRSAMVPGSGNIVAPGYFATMRVPLIAGRDFTDQDGPGAPEVAIVGDAAARRFWPGQNAIGQRLVLNGAARTGAVLQVVGVARDIRYRSVDFGDVPFVYLPHGQHAMFEMTLVVRSAGGSSVARPLRAIVAGLSRELAPISIQPLDEAMAAGLAPQRIVAFVSGSLGVVGVLLAAIGIYGVTALTVARRTREIAVRAALGAQCGAIVRLVLRQALSLTVIGAGVGVALGAGGGQVLSLLLLGVSPLDPLAMTGAVALCLAVTLVACYVPVHRALRIAATDALRSE